MSIERCARRLSLTACFAHRRRSRAQSCLPLVGGIGIADYIFNPALSAFPAATSLGIGVTITAVVLIGIYSIRRFLKVQAAKKGMYTFGDSPGMED